ncbi:unnamed protein product [Rhizoctonia solani]|uniref:NYN domain-containing protein n=1 Tax=Rhizoctonia solani TaxID=456999 RepID=A0A8H3DM20_9AGAM|nr:unnamed protein product [Rhizoctonia solani]
MFNRVGIFWDYSSCPNDNTGDESGIALALREDCVRHGDISFFKAYFGLPGSVPYEPPSASVRSAIEEVGVVTVDRPKTGFGALATDIFSFLLDHRDTFESTTVVIVSGNPDIAYLVSALHAKRAKVGLVAPSGQLDRLSSQASWTGIWDDLVKAAGMPNATKYCSDAAPLSSPPAPSTSSTGSTSDYSLVDGILPSCDSSTKDPSPGPASTTLEVEAPQLVSPAPVVPSITYTVTNERIPEPRGAIKGYDIYTGRTLQTSSHKLQMLEDDPLYMVLVKDPEAIRIKTWGRKLKQLYFHQDIRTNPQAPSELDTLYTSLEQYANMSRNYLAFSKIGKLLTQISQHYLDAYDYRQTYKTRAKELLTKWEPLARSSTNE